ncbi:MAG TPA: DinB family protein, partial [Candidatus Nitrosotenuis sp.]|nr:DinB family protein [Candidatus Nitrosotenuis sp.]
MTIHSNIFCAGRARRARRSQCIIIPSDSNGGIMRGGPSKELLPGVELLEQTPIIIEKILICAGRDALLWKPSAERWSISEVLAHLAEVETVFCGRARSMVEQENPALEAYDQNAAYAAGKYSAG